MSNLEEAGLSLEDELKFRRFERKNPDLTLENYERLQTQLAMEGLILDDGCSPDGWLWVLDPKTGSTKRHSRRYVLAELNDKIPWNKENVEMMVANGLSLKSIARSTGKTRSQVLAGIQLLEIATPRIRDGAFKGLKGKAAWRYYHLYWMSLQQTSAWTRITTKEIKVILKKMGDAAKVRSAPLQAKLDRFRDDLKQRDTPDSMWQSRLIELKTYAQARVSEVEFNKLNWSIPRAAPLQLGLMGTMPKRERFILKPLRLLEENLPVFEA